MLRNFFTQYLEVVHTDRDMIIIVDSNEPAELQMASNTGGLGGNAFHSTTVTEEYIGVVVDEVKPWLVERSSHVRLGKSKTNGVTETLAERASGHLYAVRVVRFWMAWGDAIDSLWSSSESHTHPIAL